MYMCQHNSTKINRTKSASVDLPPFQGNAHLLLLQNKQVFVICSIAADIPCM